MRVSRDRLLKQDVNPRNPKAQIDLKTYEIYNEKRYMLTIKATKSFQPGLCPDPLDPLLGWVGGGKGSPPSSPPDTRFVLPLAPNPGDATDDKSSPVGFCMQALKPLRPVAAIPDTLVNTQTDRQTPYEQPRAELK